MPDVVGTVGLDVSSGGLRVPWVLAALGVNRSRGHTPSSAALGEHREAPGGASRLPGRAVGRTRGGHEDPVATGRAAARRQAKGAQRPRRQEAQPRTRREAGARANRAKRRRRHAGRSDKWGVSDGGPWGRGGYARGSGATLDLPYPILRIAGAMRG